MPFDFDAYNRKCATLDPDALQREWDHYTRLISGAATSTGVSGAAVPFTFGVSAIGVAVAAPAIHNARKKREIIERHLQRYGRNHVTRKRDVFTGSAISGTVGVVTLGVGSIGADAIASSAADHGLTYIAENELLVKATTHLALDGVAVAGEEAHMHKKKEKEAWKAYAKAVKEGKNPELPNPHLKMPTKSVPSVNIEPVPAISVLSPSQEAIPVTQVSTYTSVPTVEAGLQANHSVQRRHSTCNLSMDVPPTSPIYTPQTIPGGYTMVGTTTAISGPMTAGQSYALQYPDQPSVPPSYTNPAASNGSYFPQPSNLGAPTLPTRPLSAVGDVKPPPSYTDPTASNGSYFPQTSNLGPPELPTRPLSAIGDVKPPPSPTYSQPTTYSVPQQTLPTPPPAYDTKPAYLEQRHSVSYMSSQPTYAVPQFPPPPSASPASPSHRLSTPNAYTPNYASVTPLAHKRSFSCASPQDQKYSPMPEPPKYNPMNFVQPQY